jgi:hypothetical protein
MQPRASTAVAQRAALALAERALREGLPAGLDGYQGLLRCLEQGRVVDHATSVLVDQAVGVWARPGFETLVSLPRLRFEPFGYQLQAAGTALRAMRGRAILADEVGLGKTIEAGLVASELRLRSRSGWSSSGSRSWTASSVCPRCSPRTRPWDARPARRSGRW